jgi:hypothetical protein
VNQEMEFAKYSEQGSYGSITRDLAGSMRSDSGHVLKNLNEEFVFVCGGIFFRIDFESESLPKRAATSRRRSQKLSVRGDAHLRRFCHGGKQERGPSRQRFRGDAR